MPRKRKSASLPIGAELLRSTFVGFNSLCSAAIEFSLLTEQPHSARAWFDTWSQPDPKNPKLDFYRGLLQKIDA
jgi:hypothetical protein